MRHWTSQELTLLSENYGQMTNDQIITIFPDRTFISIYKMAKKLGLRREEEVTFKNRSIARSGERSSNWNGGSFKKAGGYRFVLRKGHPRANSNGYVPEHILVWEETTGVQVPKNCCIHHLNGIKTDNRIENLCMMSHGAHTAMHNEGRTHTDETKMLISKKTKERLSDKRNHPAYKDVDIREMEKMRNSGATVKAVCERFEISKRTYYDKMEEYKNGT